MIYLNRIKRVIGDLRARAAYDRGRGLLMSAADHIRNLHDEVIRLRNENLDLKRRVEVQKSLREQAESDAAPHPGDGNYQ